MDEKLVAVADRLLLDLPGGVDEIALAVEFSDVPRLLNSDPVDSTDKTAVGSRRGGLLELPQIFRQAGDRRRRIDDVFRAVERKRAPALREVAVVTDIHAELAIAGAEDRPVGVAGLEEEFLP